MILGASGSRWSLKERPFLLLQVKWSGIYTLCWLVCSDVTIDPRTRRIRLCTGVRRLCVERFIDFQAVHGVRLLMMAGKSTSASRIELLCDNEDIECPPTDSPRQQALCLAMTLNVRLIKVYADEVADAPERFEPMSSDRV